MRGIKGISLKLFFVCFVFVLASVLLISALSYRYIQNEIKDNRVAYANQVLSKVEQFLELYFQLLQNTLNSISSSSGAWDDSLMAAQMQLDKHYGDNIAYMSNIYLIKPDGAIIGSNPVTRVFNQTQPEWLSIYRKAQQMPYYVSEPYAGTYSGWTVTIAKKIQAPSPLVVAIDLNLRAIEERLLKISLTDDYQLGIVALSGYRVARTLQSHEAIKETEYRLSVGDLSIDQLTSSKDEVLFATTAPDIPLTVVKKRMTRFEWVVFVLLDDSRLHVSMRRLQTYFVKLLAISLLLSLIVSSLVMRYIRGPVQYLMKKMREIREGNLNVKIVNRRTDEFGELAKSFEDMLARIRDLIGGLNASEEMKRRLEIQVLQSQINPHFLYNTLGAICNVVNLERYEEVDPIASALISILEYGIADSSHKVTLQQEVDNVNHYMYIQNIRYECRFQVAWNIPEELLDIRVPRMILQPIVENSLFHGYCGGQIQGEIAISAFRGEKGTTIEISDSGVGMETETASRILERGLTDESRPDRGRIGLYNIHKRIQLNYGDEYGVVVSSKPGSGTKVRLLFPEGGERL